MTRKEIESLFKTHYTQMYHLALTLLFDEAESKERHRCMNVLQHKQVHERFARLLTEDTDALVSGNTMEEQLQMEELMRYVRENLSPMEQNAFRLRYLKEMTCQEVAEALNVSRQTVHTHLKQSVEKIRKFFNSSEKQYDD